MKNSILFFVASFLAVGVVIVRIAMLDLDVAVIHQDGKCVAVSQHPGGGAHVFGAPDKSGNCRLGWRIFYEWK